jgi:hypothetical protein
VSSAANKTINSLILIDLIYATNEHFDLGKNWHPFMPRSVPDSYAGEYTPAMSHCPLGQ